MAQQDPWFAVVDEVASTNEDPGASEATTEELVKELLEHFKPAVPQDVADSCAREAARAKRPSYLPHHLPQIAYDDYLHAKPAKPYETDALVRNPRNDDTDFLHAVDQARVPQLSSDAPQLGGLGGRLEATFQPIILIPQIPTAVVQKCNVKEFLEDGLFRSAESLRAQGIDSALSMATARGISVSVDASNFAAARGARVAFRNFKVLDDPLDVKDWDHVCACIVTGHDWQFNQWYNGDKRKSDPAMLFANVRGFFPYFEEGRLPDTIRRWRVAPLLLTSKDIKAHSSLRVAAGFWEETFRFLDSHPYFRRFCIPPASGTSGGGRQE